MWWKCKKDHHWEATTQSRTNGSDCPFCSNKRIDELNSLFHTEPELVKEWNYKRNKDVDPKKISKGSGIKSWWICYKGHEWEAYIYHRTKSKSGCPFCSNKIITKENSILTTHPNLIKEWNYKKNTDTKPENYSHGSTKKVWWICKHGHEWDASIGKRSSGRGCPVCAKLNRRKKVQTN